MVNARLAAITVGALCMVGPALISFVVDPITAILCFSLGGFAHQMLSSMMYALMGDVFEKPEVATATGVAGMFGYLGGALFTLVLGALANTIGYEPLFARAVRSSTSSPPRPCGRSSACARGWRKRRRRLRGEAARLRFALFAAPRQGANAALRRLLRRAPPRRAKADRL